MSRIGLLARCENRGLGIQTWEFARHLDPQTILLDLGLSECGNHPERYPNAQPVKFRGLLPEGVVRRWLDSVDVVYTAETSYHPQFAHWCRKHGVELVVHINPEFHRLDNAATQWWAPTTWRLDHLPPSTTVVPVPVATDRWPSPAEPHRGPCRWLHVGGKTALADRNGTNAVLAAIPHLTERCEVTIAVQDPRGLSIPSNPLVTVKVVEATENYWDLYHGHDALVMPRRYGGLCLPVQEAMGAGLAVLMSNCSPNNDWPVAVCRTLPGRRERMPAGDIEVAGIDPIHLPQLMDLYADPDVRAERQEVSRIWARRMSWDVWADRYRAILSGAAVPA